MLSIITALQASIGLHGNCPSCKDAPRRTDAGENSNLNHDENQVSGSLLPAMSDKQGMQHVQHDLGPMLTADTLLSDWLRDWDPATDTFAIIGQTQEERFVELDELLLANIAEATTQGDHVLPAQGDTAEVTTSFRDELNDYHNSHQTEPQFLQTPMTPGDVEHPYFALPEDYTGLDAAFGSPQDHWPMGYDHNASFVSHEQAVDPQLQQPLVVPTNNPVIGAYQSRFSTFQAAHDSIAASKTKEIMVPLGLIIDDWELVLSDCIHYYAARLFTALCEPPVHLPEVMTTDYQKKYWREHQDSHLGLVATAIMSAPDDAEARVLLVTEEVIKLHSMGCPAYVMNRKTLKEGYKVDTTLIASARLEQIIDAATRDKYVAHDIVTGTNIQDIVRSPMAYLRRKADNSRVNAKKAMDKAEADRNKGLVARKKAAVRKGKGGAAKVQRNLYPSPAATSPVPLYGDGQPITFALGVAAGTEVMGDDAAMHFTFE